MRNAGGILTPVTRPLLADRYELLHRLGRGGMAEVWLARQTGIGGFEKLVVVKRILPELADQQAFRAMFLDEARTSSDLRHPNVVVVLEIGDDPRGLFMVMEFLDGRDAARIATRAVEKGRPVPVQHAAQIAMDAAAGLAHAHDKRDLRGAPKGIVHRDVSPHNIVVTFDGATKLVDFGIARAHGRIAQTSAGAVKGKTSYLAPELLDGADADHRADQFALGVVLWELTTGRRLFRRGNVMDTLVAVSACDVPRPTSLVSAFPRALEDVLMTALARDPAARFADCSAMERALDAFLLDHAEPSGTRRLAAYLKTLFPDAQGPVVLDAPIAPPPALDVDLLDQTPLSPPPDFSTISCRSVDVDGSMPLAEAYAIAQSAIVRLDTQDAEAALAEIAMEQARLEDALERALVSASEHDVGRALSIVRALEALRRGHDASELLLSRIDRAIHAGRAALVVSADLALLLEARGDVKKGRGRTEEALADYRAALGVAAGIDDPAVSSLILRNMAEVEVELSRLDDAEVHAGAARRLADQAGSARLAGRADVVAGQIAARRGDLDRAAALFGEARGAFEREGDVRSLGRVLADLARIEHRQGHVDEALMLCEEAREMHRATGERRYEGRVLGQIGALLAACGEAVAARGAYDEALSILREVGDRRSAAAVLMHAAALAQASGHTDVALLLSHEALAPEALPVDAPPRAAPP